ncbi:uncharacterized protein LOC134709450 [Mytilus trossulus]|uniref:uncharacterized protein LOC134709449 n=1 Tax=Mytilus trossulus TaxID=6551 RepID=UPI003004C16F
MKAFILFVVAVASIVHVTEGQLPGLGAAGGLIRPLIGLSLLDSFIGGGNGGNGFFGGGRGGDGRGGNAEQVFLIEREQQQSNFQFGPPPGGFFGQPFYVPDQRW